MGFQNQLNNKRRYRTSLDEQELRVRRRRELNKALDDDDEQDSFVASEKEVVEIFELEDNQIDADTPATQTHKSKQVKLESLSVEDEMMFEMQQVHKVGLSGDSIVMMREIAPFLHEGKETGSKYNQLDRLQSKQDPHKLNVELLKEQLLLESKRQMEEELELKRQEEQLKSINTNNNNDLESENQDDQKAHEHSNEQQMQIQMQAANLKVSFAGRNNFTDEY